MARACDWQSQGQGFDSPNLHRRIDKPLVFEFITSGLVILHTYLHMFLFFNLSFLTLHMDELIQANLK